MSKPSCFYVLLIIYKINLEYILIISIIYTKIIKNLKLILYL